jgi:PAS domain S-box-containing protein
VAAQASGPAALTAVRRTGKSRRAGRAAGLSHIRAGELHTLSRSEADSGVTDFGVETALLDRDGVIVSVNQAWLAFAEANGGDPARTGPGMSYLESCAAAGDDLAALEVAEAIRAALAGDLPGPLIIAVPCHSPAAERWYEVLISSRPGNDGRNLGATVTLSLARSRPRSQPPGPATGLHVMPGPGRASPGERAPRVPRPAAADPAAWSPGQAPVAVTPGVLRAMVDAFYDGVALADRDGTLMLANRRLEEMFGYQHGELHRQPVELLIPAHLQDNHRRHRASYDRGPVTRPMGAGARLVGLRQDGSTFPAEISLSPVQTATGRFTLAVIRDVTTARQREDLASQQAARSRDLLDDIIQGLHDVGLSLEATAQLDKDTASQQIAGALGRLDDIITSIRGSMFDRHDENPR